MYLTNKEMLTFLCPSMCIIRWQMLSGGSIRRCTKDLVQWMPKGMHWTPGSSELRTCIYTAPCRVWGRAASLSRGRGCAGGWCKILEAHAAVPLKSQLPQTHSLWYKAMMGVALTGLSLEVRRAYHAVSQLMASLAMQWDIGCTSVIEHYRIFGTSLRLAWMANPLWTTWTGSLVAHGGTAQITRTTTNCWMSTDMECWYVWWSIV